MRTRTKKSNVFFLHKEEPKREVLNFISTTSRDKLIQITQETVEIIGTS